MGAGKDLPLQGKHEAPAYSESEEISGGRKARSPRKFHMNHRHEEEIEEVSSDSSEQVSINRSGKSSQHLREIRDKQKTADVHEEEEDHEAEREEGHENFLDLFATNSPSDRPRAARPRPITLYHRSLFKFKLSCRSPPSPSSAATDATNIATNLGKLFKKQRSGEAREAPQESAVEFTLTKATRMLLLLFRGLSISLQRCYGTADCSSALHYRSFAHSADSDSSISNKSSNPTCRCFRGEADERENTKDNGGVSLHTARLGHCSKDQCGCNQKSSSPTQFSWESMPMYDDNSSHQLFQAHQQQAAQSISTITTAAELLYYSSNLMTPDEIHHSLRRRFSVDDSASRSEA